MTNPEVMANFVNVHKISALTRQNVITCVTSMKKNQTEEEAISCIVLATENQELIILDTEAFNVLTKVSVLLPTIDMLDSVALLSLVLSGSCARLSRCGW